MGAGNAGKTTLVSGRTASPNLPEHPEADHCRTGSLDPDRRAHSYGGSGNSRRRALLPGPCGYRINVIDYNSTNNVLYDAAEHEFRDGTYLDPYSKETLHPRNPRRPSTAHSSRIRNSTHR